MFAKIARLIMIGQQRFLTSPAGQYWLQLAPREQKLLGFLAVFLLLFILYSTVWEPIQLQKREAQQRLQLAQTQWQWLNEQIPEWKTSSYAMASTPKAPKSEFSDNNQLMAFLNQQLSVYKTQNALKEMKGTAKGVKVSLKSANAVKVFKWLQAIEAKGVQIDQFELEQLERGKIDAEVTCLP
ncbi:type II secretion system protein GspM [Thiomicrorhabdus indica]|uniref:type II secretion system protein GspM n=1 Tax=Thiomicrorhabdus indica TaxID=2267253 RepID=UPI002AA65EF4|nr:type II secretion system protein GspM [Thiomicrorhabdus indica]